MHNWNYLRQGWNQFKNIILQILELQKIELISVYRFSNAMFQWKPYDNALTME